VLGTSTRADTVEHLSGLLRERGVEPQAWYGVWLFSDWLDLSLEDTEVEAVAEVELRASLREPYRQLSRVFHLVSTRA
jgi:S-adenosylmethionine-dependent methyltransferase